MTSSTRSWLAALLAALLAAAASAEQAPFLMLGATTSTRDSGLLAELSQHFEARTVIAVRVIAVGTGRAL